MFITTYHRAPKEVRWGTDEVFGVDGIVPWVLCHKSQWEHFPSSLWNGSCIFQITVHGKLVRRQRTQCLFLTIYLFFFFKWKRSLSLFMFSNIGNGLIQAFFHLSFLVVLVFSYAYESSFYFCQWGKRGSILSNILTQSIFAITKLSSFVSRSLKNLWLYKRGLFCSFSVIFEWQGQARNSKLPSFSSSMRVTETSLYHRKRERWPELACRLCVCMCVGCCIHWQAELSHIISWVNTCMSTTHVSMSAMEKSWRGNRNIWSHSDQVPLMHAQAINGRTLDSTCFCFCFHLIWESYREIHEMKETLSLPISPGLSVKKRRLSALIFTKVQVSRVPIVLWALICKICMEINAYVHIHIYMTNLHDRLMMSIIPTSKMQKSGKKSHS